MARGNKIIVSANPKGTFSGGYIYGTPKPGVAVTIKAAVSPIGGRHTWEPFSGADGALRPFAILLGDEISGKLEVGSTAAFTGGPPVPGDAYVTGGYCFLYFPEPGEEFNMIFGDIGGTADDIAIADLFGFTSTSGKLKANSSYAWPCMAAMEAVTDPTADFMLWVKYGP